MSYYAGYGNSSPSCLKDHTGYNDNDNDNDAVEFEEAGSSVVVEVLPFSSSRSRSHRRYAPHIIGPLSVPALQHWLSSATTHIALGPAVRKEIRTLSSYQEELGGAIHLTTTDKGEGDLEGSALLHESQPDDYGFADDDDNNDNGNSEEMWMRNVTACSRQVVQMMRQAERENVFSPSRRCGWEEKGLLSSSAAVALEIEARRCLCKAAVAPFVKDGGGRPSPRACPLHAVHPCGRCFSLGRTSRRCQHRSAGEASVVAVTALPAGVTCSGLWQQVLAPWVSPSTDERPCLEEGRDGRASLLTARYARRGHYGEMYRGFRAGPFHGGLFLSAKAEGEEDTSSSDLCSGASQCPVYQWRRDGSSRWLVILSALVSEFCGEGNTQYRSISVLGNGATHLDPLQRGRASPAGMNLPPYSETPRFFLPHHLLIDDLLHDSTPKPPLFFQPSPAMKHPTPKWKTTTITSSSGLGNDYDDDDDDDDDGDEEEEEEEEESHLRRNRESQKTKTLVCGQREKCVRHVKKGGLLSGRQCSDSMDVPLSSLLLGAMNGTKSPVVQYYTPSTVERTEFDEGRLASPPFDHLMGDIDYADTEAVRARQSRILLRRVLSDMMACMYDERDTVECSLTGSHADGLAYRRGEECDSLNAMGVPISIKGWLSTALRQALRDLAAQKYYYPVFTDSQHMKNSPFFQSRPHPLVGAIPPGELPVPPPYPLNLPLAWMAHDTGREQAGLDVWTKNRPAVISPSLSRVGSDPHDAIFHCRDRAPGLPYVEDGVVADEASQDYAAYYRSWYGSSAFRLQCCIRAALRSVLRTRIPQDMTLASFFEECLMQFLFQPPIPAGSGLSLIKAFQKDNEKNNHMKKSILECVHDTVCFRLHTLLTHPDQVLCVRYHSGGLEDESLEADNGRAAQSSDLLWRSRSSPLPLYITDVYSAFFKTARRAAVPATPSSVNEETEMERSIPFRNGGAGGASGLPSVSSSKQFCFPLGLMFPLRAVLIPVESVTVNNGEGHSPCVPTPTLAKRWHPVHLAALPTTSSATPSPTTTTAAAASSTTVQPTLCHSMSPWTTPSGENKPPCEAGGEKRSSSPSASLVRVLLLRIDPTGDWIWRDTTPIRYCTRGFCGSTTHFAGNPNTHYNASPPVANSISADAMSIHTYNVRSFQSHYANDEVEAAMQHRKFAAWRKNPNARREAQRQQRQSSELFHSWSDGARGTTKKERERWEHSTGSSPPSFPSRDNHGAAVFATQKIRDTEAESSSDAESTTSEVHGSSSSPHSAFTYMEAYQEGERYVAQMPWEPEEGNGTESLHFAQPQSQLCPQPDPPPQQPKEEGGEESGLTCMTAISSRNLGWFETLVDACYQWMLFPDCGACCSMVMHLLMSRTSASASASAVPSSAGQGSPSCDVDHEHVVHDAPLFVSNHSGRNEQNQLVCKAGVRVLVWCALNGIHCILTPERCPAAWFELTKNWFPRLSQLLRSLRGSTSGQDTMPAMHLEIIDGLRQEYFHRLRLLYVQRAKARYRAGVASTATSPDGTAAAPPHAAHLDHFPLDWPEVESPADAYWATCPVVVCRDALRLVSTGCERPESGIAEEEEEEQEQDVDMTKKMEGPHENGQADYPDSDKPPHMRSEWRDASAIGKRGGSADTERNNSSSSSRRRRTKDWRTFPSSALRSAAMTRHWGRCQGRLLVDQVHYDVTSFFFPQETSSSSTSPFSSSCRHDFLSFLRRVALEEQQDIHQAAVAAASANMLPPPISSVEHMSVERFTRHYRFMSETSRGPTGSSMLLCVVVLRDDAEEGCAEEPLPPASWRGTQKAAAAAAFPPSCSPPLPPQPKDVHHHQEAIALEEDDGEEEEKKKMREREMKRRGNWSPAAADSIQYGILLPSRTVAQGRRQEALLMTAAASLWHALTDGLLTSEGDGRVREREKGEGEHEAGVSGDAGTMRAARPSVCTPSAHVRPAVCRVGDGWVAAGGVLFVALAKALLGMAHKRREHLLDPSLLSKRFKESSSLGVGQNTACPAVRHHPLEPLEPSISSQERRREEMRCVVLEMLSRAILSVPYQLFLESQRQPSPLPPILPLPYTSSFTYRGSVQNGLAEEDHKKLEKSKNPHVMAHNDGPQCCDLGNDAFNTGFAGSTDDQEEKEREEAKRKWLMDLKRCVDPTQKETEIPFPFPVVWMQTMEERARIKIFNDVQATRTADVGRQKTIHCRSHGFPFPTDLVAVPPAVRNMFKCEKVGGDLNRTAEDSLEEEAVDVDLRPLLFDAAEMEAAASEKTMENKKRRESVDLRCLTAFLFSCTDSHPHFFSSHEYPEQSNPQKNGGGRIDSACYPPQASGRFVFSGSSNPTSVKSYRKIHVERDKDTFSCPIDEKVSPYLLESVSDNIYVINEVLSAFSQILIASDA